MRRPLLGPFGSPVVAVLCLWELVALLPGSPIPTISQTVRRHRMFGAFLLAALAQHWYLERVDEALTDGTAVPFVSGVQSP